MSLLQKGDNIASLLVSRLAIDCGELATPLLTVKPVGVYSTTLDSTCTVLSYLLSRLLPQW
jgi:hypothetical protein